MVQRTLRRINLGGNIPSSIIGTNDNIALQLTELAQLAGDLAVSMYTWPQLQKKFTLTMVADQQEYALPGDFDRWCFSTSWDQTNDWELLGPIRPFEFEWRTEGIIFSSPRRRFTIRGLGDSKILIHPTPESGEAGETLSFVYYSTNWIKPQDWAASASVGADEYRSYNGNYYQALAGGTTGSTAPTHTSGSVDDGGIIWTYISDAYDRFMADTDECNIDEKTIGYGIEYLFFETKGLEYQNKKRLFEDQLKRQSSNLRGARPLNMTRSKHPHLISSLNAPNTGFG